MPEIPFDPSSAAAHIVEPMLSLSQAVRDASAPVKSVNSPVAGLLSVGFEEKWAEFLANSRHPESYGADHKAMAILGYAWAVDAFRKFGNQISPKV